MFSIEDDIGFIESVCDIGRYEINHPAAILPKLVINGSFFDLRCI